MLSNELVSVTNSWSFIQWELDIVGPFPQAPGQKKFILVATNYFSKWVEVKSYSNIKDSYVVQLVWKNIICMFGMPRVLLMNKQFVVDKLKI